MDLNARKGLIPNLTSRMSESKRNQWKDKYIKLKKSSIVLTVGTITFIDAKQLAIDLLASKVKRFGYKASFVFLLGPWMQISSIPFYVMGGARKIRMLAIAFADIGSKISAGEMTLLNCMWYGADLVLFGEVVPIINSSRDLCIYRNESSVFEELLNGIN